MNRESIQHRIRKEKLDNFQRDVLDLKNSLLQPQFQNSNSNLDINLQIDHQFREPDFKIKIKLENQNPKSQWQEKDKRIHSSNKKSSSHSHLTKQEKSQRFVGRMKKFFQKVSPNKTKKTIFHFKIQSNNNLLLPHLKIKPMLPKVAKAKVQSAIQKYIQMEQRIQKTLHIKNGINGKYQDSIMSKIQNPENQGSSQKKFKFLKKGSNRGFSSFALKVSDHKKKKKFDLKVRQNHEERVFENIVRNELNGWQRSMSRHLRQYF